MKSITTLIFVLISSASQSQQIIPIHQKIITYKVYMTETKGNNIKGYLAGFNDSMVFINKDRISKNLNEDAFYKSAIAYPYWKIRDISFRNPNSVLTGLIIGFAVGAGVGLLLTPARKTVTSPCLLCSGSGSTTYLAAKDERPYMFASTAGATIGMGIGALVSKNYDINASKNAFDSVRNFMQQKLYR